MTTGLPNVLDNEAVRMAVVSALAGKLHAAGSGPVHIDEKSQLLELGLIDSEDLVEIILDVEQQFGCEFDPAEINLETGLTIAGLAAAFVVRG